MSAPASEARVKAERGRTYVLKPADLSEPDKAKKWIVIDAENLVVGRLAAFVATRLRGKHRGDYTPHVDCGDHVIIVNAEKVALTGAKRTDKVYYRHTGYPGGIKSATAGWILDGAHPERVVKKAVERMLPKESPLARRQFSHLHVYAGADHPHAAQQPEAVDVAALHPRNSRAS